MRIIALMNQKGGVGKTTTTVNLGAALAEAGKRVCLIDLDPQAHLTINYGVEPSADIVSLYNVLVEERPIAEALHQVDANVTLVPSSIDLAAAEIELVSVLGREQILKKRMEAAGFDYDYVLLDCPPSLGLLTINALAVASEVIIPMQPHFLALQGVGKLLETVHLVSRRMNPGLKVCGIVLTMFDSQTKLSAEVVNDLNSFIEAAKGKPLPWARARIFTSKIRRNIKLAESPSFGKTILKYDSASNGATDYRSLAREILAMETAATPASAAGTPSVVPAGESPRSTAATAAPVTSVAAPAAATAPATPAVDGRSADLSPLPPPAQIPAPEPATAEMMPPTAVSSAADPSMTPGEAPEASPPAVAPAPPEPQAPQTPPRKPRPARPRAVLVSPEEAARLKAANVTDVVGKPNP